MVATPAQAVRGERAGLVVPGQVFPQCSIPAWSVPAFITHSWCSHAPLVTIPIPIETAGPPWWRFFVKVIQAGGEGRTRQAKG
ncbi:hypothetical protein Pmani_005718 [Petrolisthes manimaculis]|uniref:Uncharacterized protein n=1 Tax=Petrolisthes manimaculis TaxID=1843537 RepID=A0AAE1QBW5_9EUCA|nr:hypothetical protein Pmani_005718 [Petrolisthes manimaculis]